MLYEIIQEIKNNCCQNQMRDVFFSEQEIESPDEWISQKEPRAEEIRREDTDCGIRYYVNNTGLITVYNLTEAE